MNKKTSIILVVFALIIIGAVYFQVRKGSWTTYEETDFNFSVSYPKGWDMRDNLTKTTCCLFLAFAHKTVTSTTTAKGETITDTTVQDQVKMQIGNYDRKKYDPYKEGTTTKIRLGNNTWDVGTSSEVKFYLLPKTENEGIGTAFFTAIDVKPEVLKEAEDILATIRFTK